MLSQPSTATSSGTLRPIFLMSMIARRANSSFPATMRSGFTFPVFFGQGQFQHPEIAEEVVDDLVLPEGSPISAARCAGSEAEMPVVHPTSFGEERYRSASCRPPPVPSGFSIGGKQIRSR